MTHDLPKFQQLQQQMTQMIRDPEAHPYQGEKVGGLPVASERLAAYQSLFFNNLHGFVGSVFPVLSEVLGEETVARLTRDFLKQHQAHTPLFHELGQEFLQFLSHYEGLADLPPWTLSFAHYEWVELALMVAPESLIPEAEQADWELAEHLTLERPLRLSDLAWVVSYEWPVDQIALENADQIQPEWTGFLVYRDDTEQVQFIKLTPLLAQLLHLLSEQPASFETLWQSWMQAYWDAPQDEMPPTHLKSDAFNALQSLSEEGVLLTRVVD